MPPPEPLTTSPRARYRAQLRHEIKAIALRQLAKSGPAGVSINAIARELGMSGPALYRYFGSRDELLTELVLGAYEELAENLREAVAASRARDPRQRFAAFAHAFRSWGVANPDRYRLLYTPPLPGYDSHTEQLIAAGQAAMNLLVDILRDADEPARPRLARPLRAEIAQWAERRSIEIDAETAFHAIIVWSRLHGFVSLEIGGNFRGMRIDADSLFDLELAAMAPVTPGTR
jgi:AcrR family transcriptional regulator